MTKTKKPKSPPINVTPAMVQQAANTKAVRQLVRLANAFWRASVRQPFSLETSPFFGAMHIAEGKGYRRGNVSLGERFTVKGITLGKKAGLIFAFVPVAKLEREGLAIEWIEMSWDDLVNQFPPLAEALDNYLGTDSNIFVKDLNFKVSDAIAKNPAMHKILSEGFKLAMEDRKDAAADEQLEALPGYGMF